MVEKITVALSIQEIFGSLFAMAFPLLQSLNLSLNLSSKTKKRPKPKRSKKTSNKPTNKTIFTWTPLLVGCFAFVFYTGLVTPDYLNQVRFSQPMPSGAWFVATGGDLLIFFALFCLAADILVIWKVSRKTHENRKSGGFWLSLIVFIASVCLFLVSKNVGSGVFLILLIISLIDLVLWTQVFKRR